MSSKSSILSQIKQLNMEEKPLPEIPEFAVAEELKLTFSESIAGNKGQVVPVSELEELITLSKFAKIFSSCQQFSHHSNCEVPSHPAGFADLDLAILEGQVAVAENGAIWLDESNLGMRAIPFITSHLVIVVKEKNLVGNMHQAYERIGLDHSGFGVFIAGPSKTADIEQSLVVGAHGAMSLRVAIV